MEYTIEIASVAMAYVRSFIQIGSGILKLIIWDTQTHRQDEDRIRLL
jgi:hypothetical protein